MIVTSDTSGIDELRRRIAEAQSQLQPLLQDAAHKSGETVAGWLKDTSPRARYAGLPPPGDGPGRLADSYRVKTEQHGNETKTTVMTTQPQKLYWVRFGRGEVRPVRKRALWWPGLVHPVQYSGPSRMNAFVAKILQKADTAVEPEMKRVITKLNEIMEG